MSPLTTFTNAFSVGRAKYSELLEFIANVVNAIKSSTRDNLPTLSRATRVAVATISVASFVVGCFQWTEANRQGQKANRLSLVAICEGYPHRQRDPECKPLLDSALPPLSRRSLTNISVPINPSDTLFIITTAIAYLCVLSAVVWILRSRRRLQTVEVDPEQLAPHHNSLQHQDSRQFQPQSSGFKYKD